jgi:hypothetical protein
MIQASNAVENLDQDALQVVKGLLGSFFGQSLISALIISIIDGQTYEATQNLTSIRDGARAWSQWLVKAFLFSPCSHSFSCPKCC